MTAATPHGPRASEFTFDEAPGTYRWWYFDALSDDGETSVVAIFFVGSVFSPTYADRIARGVARASTEHVAVNFALVRRGAFPVWVFSEYDATRLSQGEGSLTIAGSSLTRSRDGSVHVSIDDVRVARGTPVRATLDVKMLEAPIGDARGIALGSERHRWRCHSPRTRVEVSVPTHGVHFVGTGYHDENWGDEPPHAGLRSWSWGRVHAPLRTRVFFDVNPLVGPRKHFEFDTKSGAREEFRAPAQFSRSLGGWLLPVPREMDAGKSESGNRVVVRNARSLERAPFYHRFLANFDFGRGEAPARGIAEHVDFQRFAHPIVRRMVAYRIAEPDRGTFGRIP